MWRFGGETWRSWPGPTSRTAIRWLWMAVSITPVVTGAALNGPPPGASSIYRKAICLPSRDQRGRAAYPLRFVSFCGFEPLAFAVQSCAWSFSLGAEKNASVWESGDQAGPESVLSPVVAMLTIAAGVLRDVSRIHVCFDVGAAVDSNHATCVTSGERAK